MSLTQELAYLTAILLQSLYNFSFEIKKKKSLKVKQES